MRRETSSEAALLLAVLLWSGTYAASKYGVEATTPLGYFIGRYALGGAATVVAMLVREGVPHFRRRDLGLLFTAALCGVSLNQGAFVWSLSLTSASNVALLLGTTPIWTAIFAVLTRQERLDGAHWLALGGGIVGVALIVIGGSGTGAGAMNLGGAALALSAAAGWGAYSVLIRPLMLRYAALQISSFTIIVGMLVLLPFGLPGLMRLDYAAVPVIAWVAMVYTGVLALAVTNVLYFTAVHRVGAARAALYGYLTPFLGVIVAVLLLGDDVSLVQIAGGVVVVLAVAMGRRNRSAVEEPAA